MCNSQGNLTELDDNFCAIGIAATTLIFEGFALMPMNFVIWSFTEQTASSIVPLAPICESVWSRECSNNGLFKIILCLSCRMRV